MESSSWVRRADDEGNTYYIRVDITPESQSQLVQDLEQQQAEVTWSWYPPEHFIVCSRCKINFATRRLNETGARFCIGCYADGLLSKKFPAASTWTKLPVQQAKRIVCPNTKDETLIL